MTEKQTFWDHLDELRSCLVKIVVATVLLGVVAFFFKDELFTVILAPKYDDFVTYRLFESIAARFSVPMDGLDFQVSLINTELAQQFIVHVKMAMFCAFLLVSPYALYQLFRFVSPALYSNERKYVVRVVGGGYVMFLMGVALSYFLIFPLTFRFLGTYQVSAEVQNFISLSSYIDTLMVLCFLLGIVFEIPILCWLFAKLGFLTAEFMRRYRKHAIVIVLIVAAVITPTSDAFTLLLVSGPIYLLYEVSVLIVAHTEKNSE
ncbi:MAG: twin-arginine translocase subunit TatC [Paludibacteraceae bacterium]|nr:twin-arginine translocase subunit TatC [Paludibacteraceae bacterium]